MEKIQGEKYGMKKLWWVNWENKSYEEIDCLQFVKNNS